jgi:hypothetical protein
MKNLIMICALGILAATFGSTSKAVPVNPANWHFSLVTDGNCYDDGPLSPAVDTDYQYYDCNWVLTHVDDEFDPWLALELAGTTWVDIWGCIPSNERSGDSSHDGPLPFIDELILHIEHPEITADFLLSVDAGGYGTISIDSITLGWVEDYKVTGARFQGDVTITGVPEPATLSFFGLR